MSKKLKKIHKKIDPFTAKVVDPILGGMGLWNVQGRNAHAEAAQKTAEQQAAINMQGIQAQADQSREAARGAALQMQSNSDRDRALQAAQEAAAPTREEVDVDMMADTSETAMRRKRFQNQSVGGTGGGTSIRL